MKKKSKLDKRHEIFYGGKNNIFPYIDRLEKLGPLAVKKKVVKGVKFAADDCLESNASDRS